MDQDFPGKVTHCWHLFLYLDRSKSVEEDDTIMNKVAKGKGKPRQKWKKPGTGNRAEEQDNESTYSFQNYDSRRLLMFLCQGWYSHKEKENLVLNIMWDKFWFAGDFLFEIWTAWSPASTCRFHKESFFLSWQNGTLSFFFGPVFFFSLLFSFFYRWLSSAFDFPCAKIFP